MSTNPKKNPKAPHPTRSTTHRERYYHIHLSLDESEHYQAYTLFAREEDPGSNVWRFGYSLCHRNDQFCRRTGRAIARRRYFNERDTLSAMKLEDGTKLVCFEFDNGFESIIEWRD